MCILSVCVCVGSVYVLCVQVHFEYGCVCVCLDSVFVHLRVSVLMFHGVILSGVLGRDGGDGDDVTTGFEMEERKKTTVLLRKREREREKKDNSFVVLQDFVFLCWSLNTAEVS